MTLVTRKLFIDNDEYIQNVILLPASHIAVFFVTGGHHIDSFLEYFVQHDFRALAISAQVQVPTIWPYSLVIFALSA